MHTRKLPSGSWRVEAYGGYDPISKKKFTKSFTGKSLADLKRKAALWEAEHKIDHDPGTLGGALDRYIASAPLSPSTKRGYTSLRRTYPDYLLKTPLVALSAPLLERFIAESSVSPKTIKNRLGLITAAAKAQGVSLPYVKAPKVVPPDLNIPDADTVKRTLDAADPEMRIVIMLAATGPLRLGEICGLSLDDFDGDTVHVRHSLVYGDDHKYHLKEPKTKKSDRFIDLPHELVEEIRSQGYVTRFTPKGIEKRFRTLLRHAGIEHYRFHDLRHFCISELLSQGIDEAYVSERSGHTSHATMQRYIHVLGQRRKEASKKMLSHFDNILG